MATHRKRTPTAAIAIGLLLTAIGTAHARMIHRPPVMVPIPVGHATTDRKMSDMNLESCLHGTGNEWLCTGKDGHSYGCQYDPANGIDRCQRL